jgi:hypothetical protein
MASTPPAVFYERLFLNPPRHHGGAYIIAEVEAGAYDQADGDEHRWVSSTLRISDCSRVIELDFPTGNDDTRAATMFKLDLLIETLTGFRAALQAGCEFVDGPREPAKAAQ